MSVDGLNARLVMKGIGLCGCRNMLVDHVRILRLWKNDIYFGDPSGSSSVSPRTRSLT